MSQCSDISVQTDNKGSQSLSLLASPLLSFCLLLCTLFFSILLYLSFSFPFMPCIPLGFVYTVLLPFFSSPYLLFCYSLHLCLSTNFSNNYWYWLTCFCPTSLGVVIFWPHHNFFKLCLEYWWQCFIVSVFCWQCFIYSFRLLSWTSKHLSWCGWRMLFSIKFLIGG